MIKSPQICVHDYSLRYSPMHAYPYVYIYQTSTFLSYFQEFLMIEKVCLTPYKGVKTTIRRELTSASSVWWHSFLHVWQHSRCWTQMVIWRWERETFSCEPFCNIPVLVNIKKEREGKLTFGNALFNLTPSIPMNIHCNSYKILGEGLMNYSHNYSYTGFYFVYDFCNISS